MIFKAALLKGIISSYVYFSLCEKFYQVRRSNDYETTKCVFGVRPTRIIYTAFSYEIEASSIKSGLERKGIKSVSLGCFPHDSAPPQGDEGRGWNGDVRLRESILREA